MECWEFWQFVLPGSHEKCLCRTFLTWCFLTMCCSWSMTQAASLSSQHWQRWKELEKSPRILSLLAHSRGKTRGWCIFVSSHLLWCIFWHLGMNLNHIYLSFKLLLAFFITEKTANWLTKVLNIHLIGLSQPHTMVLSVDQSPSSPLKRELTWKNSRLRREFCIIKTWPSSRMSSMTMALLCARLKLWVASTLFH